MGLILLPGDIADVRLMDDHLPLLAGQRRDMDLAIHGFGRARATKRKHASITRVMQDPEHLVMLEVPPHEFALVRPTAYPSWEAHLVLPEGADRRGGRPCAPKRAKQEPYGVL